VKYEPGQILRFTYNPEATDEDSGDRFKEVLVLHPGWQGKMHAIDLKRLTAAERAVLQAVLDPKTRDKVKAGKPHRFPLVNDIVKRMNPLQEIKNPVSFYTRFVKVFLRNKDAYRQYFPNRMINITIVKKTDVKGNMINPNPLFHKVETKAEPEKPKAPVGGMNQPKAAQSRMDMIKARQAALAKKNQF
jgi:hypothetical protein